MFKCKVPAPRPGKFEERPEADIAYYSPLASDFLHNPRDSCQELGFSSSFSFTVSVNQETAPVPRQQGEFHQFLHDVDHTVVVRRRPHPAIVIEFLPSLGHGRLIGDCDHAHPATEYPQRVDGIEGLRASAYLHDGQGPALCRTHAAVFEGPPVNLVLEYASDGSVPFRSNPDLALRPLRPLTQFLHLGMILANAIQHR